MSITNATTKALVEILEEIDDFIVKPHVKYTLSEMADLGYVLLDVIQEKITIYKKQLKNNEMHMSIGKQEAGHYEEWRGYFLINHKDVQK